MTDLRSDPNLTWLRRRSDPQDNPFKDHVEPGFDSQTPVDLDGLSRELAFIPRQAFTPADIDPVVKGLLTHLPAPGSVWPSEDRKLWLELLEGTFRLIFREKPRQDSAARDVAMAEAALAEEPPQEAA